MTTYEKLKEALDDGDIYDAKHYAMQLEAERARLYGKIEAQAKYLRKLTRWAAEGLEAEGLEIFLSNTKAAHVEKKTMKTKTDALPEVGCAALVGALREGIARKLDEARPYGGDYYTGYRDGLVMALNAIDGAKESAPIAQSDSR